MILRSTRLVAAAATVLVSTAVGCSSPSPTHYPSREDCMLFRPPPCSGAEEALSEPEVMRKAVELNRRTLTVRGKLGLGEYPCKFSLIKEEPDLCAWWHRHRWVYIGSILLAVYCRCGRDGEERDCPVPSVTDDVIVTGRFVHEVTDEQQGMVTKLTPEKACRVVAKGKSAQ